MQQARLVPSHRPRPTSADESAGGLSVVDAKSSQPLFALRGVRPWAHLEFCKGFAIFDVGQGERSSHPSFHHAQQHPLLLLQHDHNFTSNFTSSDPDLTCAQLTPTFLSKSTGPSPPYPAAPTQPLVSALQSPAPPNRLSVRAGVRNRRTNPSQGVISLTIGPSLRRRAVLRSEQESMEPTSMGMEAEPCWVRRARRRCISGTSRRRVKSR